MEKEDKRIKIVAAIYWFSQITITVLICQWFISENWKEMALSVLLGTCGTLVGVFAALLSSPYGLKDEERLTKVSSTLATLVTGYLLAKVIDPLVSDAVKTPESVRALIFIPYNSANILVSIIGFLGGFLATYGFRAYISEHPAKIQTDADTQQNKDKIIDETKNDKTTKNP